MGRDVSIKAGVGLGGLVVALWAHGALLGGTAGDVQSTGGAVAGAAAGAIALVSLTLLAAGIDGFRPAALVPALLAAASPAFAASLCAGSREPFAAACCLAGAYRAFMETHVPGRLPISALLFGAGAALAPGGIFIPIAVFVQKIAFARKFRLERANYIFAVIWLALALAAWGAGRAALGAVTGGAVTGGAAPTSGPPLAGPGRVLVRFWREADGLAVLPFLLVLLAGWKSKAVTFRLTLAGFVLAGSLAGAAFAPLSDLPRPLAPALAFAFLIVGEALARAGALLETAGLRGRGRTVLVAAVLCALALGQLWPTLVLLVRPAYQ